MDGDHSKKVFVNAYRPQYGMLIRTLWMALAIALLWATTSGVLWLASDHGFGRGWPVLGAGIAVGLGAFILEGTGRIWPVTDTVFGALGYYSAIIVASWLIAFL